MSIYLEWGNISPQPKGAECMQMTWTVTIDGSTNEKPEEELDFDLIDQKEFTNDPIAIQEDWLDTVLSIAAMRDKYRIKTVLKTVIGPQKEDYEGRDVLFIYALLKKNAIPLAFLLGALKNRGYLVLSIWPPQFVNIVKEHPEKETVLSMLIQIAKNPELFEFVNICCWVTQKSSSFPPPYAS